MELALPAVVLDAPPVPVTLEANFYKLAATFRQLGRYHASDAPDAAGNRRIDGWAVTRAIAKLPGMANLVHN